MVCSPLDSMAEFPEFVTLADSAESWIEAINVALATDSDAKRARRKELASSSSWDHRAGEILDHLETEISAQSQT
jgi:hypothetical protein